MSESQDNENENNFWMRIQNNNELKINDSINLFNTFFMFLRDDPNCIIVTGSLVKDDRDMGLKDVC
jgi:hypothetical protein